MHGCSSHTSDIMESHIFFSAPLSASPIPDGLTQELSCTENAVHEANKIAS